MKYAISLLFLGLLFLPSSASALICGNRFMLNISGQDVCGLPADCGAYGMSLPSNCTASFSSADSVKCLCVYQVCCDDTVASYEDGILYGYTYSLTPAQDPATEANDMYQTYNTAYTLPPPAPDFVLTGSFSGYVYGVTYDMNGNSVMDYVSWKRGYYTKIGSVGGTIEPIPGGGTGGGTGGGLTYDETAQAVGEGVGTSFGTGDDFGSGAVGAADEVTTSTGPGDDYDTTYDEVERDSITTKVTNFLSSNPLVSAFTGTGVVIAGSTCSLSTTIYGKVVEIDFCSTQSYLQILGYFILLVAGLYSFYVAWGLN